MFMTAEDYRDSLRSYTPRVYLNGEQVESVADDERLLPGIRAVGVTYDFALRPEHAPLMVEVQSSSGQPVNRMLHINRHTEDLLSKLEAVRLLCRESGCAQRYLTHDALNSIHQATHRMDQDSPGEYHPRFMAYLHDIQARDLTLGVAMTDAKGDRSARPARQARRDSYLHVSERRADGIVINGVKAIVTGGPYMHELLVMPCRTMTEADEDFAVCCAVPVDAEGLTQIARPAGRVRRRRSSAPNTANRRRCVFSTMCSCPGSACSWPVSGSTRITWSAAMPRTIGTAALARGRGSGTC